MKPTCFSSKALLLIFLLFALLLSVKYLGFPFEDNFDTAPLVSRMLDSSYLENDWFVNSNEGYNVRYYHNLLLFYSHHLIGNLAFLHYLFFLLFNLGIIYYAYRLAYHFSKHQAASLFASFLLIFGLAFSLGGNSLLRFSYTPSIPAWFFATGAIYYYFKEKMHLSGLFFGFATLFQLLIGLHGYMLFSLLLGFFLLSSRFEKSHLKKIISFQLFYYLVALFALVPTFFGQAKALVSPSLLVTILGLRSPHHYLPFSWSVESYLFFGAFLLLSLYCAYHCSILKTYKERLGLLSIFIFLFFLIGTLFVELFSSFLVIRFQFFRMSVFFILFGYLFIGLYMYEKISSSRSSLEKLFYTLIPLAFLFRPLVFFSLLLVLISLMEKKLGKNPFTYLKGKALVLTSFLSTLLLIILVVFFYEWLALIFSTYSGYLFSYLLIPLLFYFGLLALLTKRFTLGFIATPLLVLSFIFFLVNPVLSAPALDPSSQELLDFISTQTPLESTFLVPVGFEQFRFVANRAIVVDFKAFPFDQQAMVDWHDRVNDITSNSLSSEGDLREGYARLTTQDVERLSRDYHFSYAVFEQPTFHDLEVVYQNQKYVVYSLESQP